MRKLIFIFLLFLFSCEKNMTVCGEVVAISDPVRNLYTGEFTYQLAVMLENGNMAWIEVTEATYNTAFVGQYLCNEK